MKDNKKLYEEPKFDLIELETTDVIATSNFSIENETYTNTDDMII